MLLPEEKPANFKLQALRNVFIEVEESGNDGLLNIKSIWFEANKAEGFRLARPKLQIDNT